VSEQALGIFLTDCACEVLVYIIRPLKYYFSSSLIMAANRHKQHLLYSTAMNGEYFDAVITDERNVDADTAQCAHCLPHDEDGLSLGLSQLPDELILHCMSFLNVRSLLTVRCSNTAFSELASRNEAGWTERCQELWAQKVFVSQAARNLPSSLMGYKSALQDSRIRQHVTLDELCYDETEHCGTIWSFRFKVSAGPDWTSWDPWWMGSQARQMVFLRNGSVKQYVPEEDQLTMPRFGQLVDPPVAMEWRFIRQPMDMPQREVGSYIRFSVGGRDVPTYVVKRSPTKNWGFVAESCWGVYTSFEMPLRIKQDPRMRLRRSPSGRAHWLRDPETDEEDNLLVSPLNDDSIFTITNEVQWREALLYNFGASVLPDGAGATEDFDRMFGQTLHVRGVLGIDDPPHQET
jgi:hypothetical protein